MAISFIGGTEWTVNKGKNFLLLLPEDTTYFNTRVNN